MNYNHDNFGTPQQYMRRFSVNDATFRSRVKRGRVIFAQNGMVDYAKTNAMQRGPGAAKGQRPKLHRFVCHADFDEFEELKQVHRRHKLRREKQGA